MRVQEHDGGAKCGRVSPATDAGINTKGKSALANIAKLTSAPLIASQGRGLKRVEQLVRFLTEGPGPLRCSACVCVCVYIYIERERPRDR